jgi:carbamoyltransferase
MAVHHRKGDSLIICGLKLTHDGAVAVVEDAECVLSVEMEKLSNNPRYSPVHDLAIIPRLLADYGYKVDDVDHWVIDGWDGQREGSVSLRNDGEPVRLTVAAYRETAEQPDLFQPGYHGTIPIDGLPRPYTSYLHLGGHVASAYCSSGFAAAGEPSFVLAWDGGTFPRLYHVDPASGVSNGGAIFPLIGHAYATAAHHFGPYARPTESQTVDDLAVAGKLMAYIALGKARDHVQQIIAATYRRHFEVGELASGYRGRIGGWGSNAEPSLRFVHAFFRELR